MKFLKYLKKLSNKQNRIQVEKCKIPHQTVFSNLRDNIEFINNNFYHSSDLIIKNIENNNFKGSILFLESITNFEMIQNDFLDMLDKVKDKNLDILLESTKITTSDDLAQAIDSILEGCCILILDEYDKVFMFFAQKIDNREINEPENETILRGSHRGFIEDLLTNISSIRKLIVNPKLTIKYFIIGSETKTKVALIYMSNLANSTLINKVEKRLQSISTDMVIGSSFLEEFIEDSPSSIFPQILDTERPDRVVAQLLEGRVAIMTEGSPTASIMPATFFSFYQAPDDYNSRWITATFFRIIRLMSFIIAVILPSLYIAVISFHFEVIPIHLILLVKNSIHQIPYPPLIEAFIVEIIIQLVIEASIRLPRPIGQTITIVGGLVIGDSIIRAGLVSNVMIIIIALTAIASFSIPSNEMLGAVTIIRWPFMLLASIFGFIGITFGMMFLLIHLCKLESLGTPYFTPLAPLRLQDLKDTFLRLPIWTFNRRPLDSYPKAMQRQGLSREWVHSEKRNE